MKYIRFVFIITLLLFLLIFCYTETFAIDTQFTTETLSEEKKEHIIENVNITMLTEEPTKQAIWCFDVNQNGLIAIGGKVNSNKTVCIYTSNGEFQYGYNFEDEGSFGVELKENILIIYFVRGDIAVTVNSAGEVEDVVAIQKTSENNSYWDSAVFATKKEVNGKTYTIKNDMGIFNKIVPNYSQLTVTDENGTDTILYDVNSEQYIKTVVCTCGIILCFTVALVFSIKKLKH